VTRLLLERGYFEDQVAYAKHVLTTSEEDLAVWRAARRDPAGIALSLAGRLKDAACFTALHSRPSEDEMAEKMMKVIKRFPRAIAGGTFKNVDLVMEMFLKDLLRPLFTGVREWVS